MINGSAPYEDEMEGTQEDTEEDQEDENESILDSNGDAYFSDRVVGKYYTRILSENEFVCFKPEYGQNINIGIFRFTQEQLERLVTIIPVISSSHFSTIYA